VPARHALSPFNRTEHTGVAAPRACKLSLGFPAAFLPLPLTSFDMAGPPPSARCSSAAATTEQCPSIDSPLDFNCPLLLYPFCSHLARNEAEAPWEVVDTENGKQISVSIYYSTASISLRYDIDSCVVIRKWKGIQPSVEMAVVFTGQTVTCKPSTNSRWSGRRRWTDLLDSSRKTYVFSFDTYLLNAEHCVPLTSCPACGRDSSTS
jgi:hypothetical protein